MISPHMREITKYLVACKSAQNSRKLPKQALDFEESQKDLVISRIVATMREITKYFGRVNLHKKHGNFPNRPWIMKNLKRFGYLPHCVFSRNFYKVIICPNVIGRSSHVIQN
jgi:hypothetical protein